MPLEDPIFGRPDAAAWKRYEAKGNLVSARPRYVREQWGEDAVREVAARLDERARAVFESNVLPFVWHSFATLGAIDRAIAEGPMRGDVTRMKHFGSTIARYDLPTLYKVLFKLGSPAFIIKRVGVIYSTYVRGGGTMAGEAVTSNRATISFTNGSLPRYFCAHGCSGWFTAAIELSGGKNVDVHHTDCIHESARRCAWEASWS